MFLHVVCNKMEMTSLGPNIGNVDSIYIFQGFLEKKYFGKKKCFHKGLDFFVLHVGFMASLIPFMSTFFGLFSLSNCLLENNLYILKIYFLHVHTHFSFIHNILTCL